ncbi:MAG: hypothetical protein ACREX4_14485 [Gammaproteobacteria bacterium]
MGVPDLYGDTLEIIRAHRAAQILDLAVSTARPSPGELWTLHRRLRDDFGFVLPCMMNESGMAVQRCGSQHRCVEAVGRNRVSPRRPRSSPKGC